MKSYNTQIVENINKYLAEAEKRIWLNVPWFTHKELFKTLCKKANEGVSVQIILQEDSINRQVSFDHEDIGKWGGRVFWYKQENSPSSINHEKYCVIDDKYIIYGSFNWTYNANNNNLESILVGEKTGEYELIDAFKKRFTDVLAEYFSADPTPEGKFVVETGYAYKLQITLLQNECAWLETQINEIQNTYGHIEQYIQLHAGELMIEKIRIESLIAEKKARQVKKKIYETEFEKKKAELEEFKRIFENNQANSRQINQKATEKKNDDIKQLYRELAKQMHPDKFVHNPELYQKATELMAQINLAYENNDLEAMRTLQAIIETGAFEKLDMWKSDMSSSELEKTLKFWKQRKQELFELLESLQKQDFYDIFTEKVNLDDFVRQLKEKLESDIRILNENLKHYNV